MGLQQGAWRRRRRSECRPSSARESLEEGMSPLRRAPAPRSSFEDTEDGFEAGSAWTDPAAIADTIVQGMVSLIPMGATSITAARMAGASAAKV